MGEGESDGENAGGPESGTGEGPIREDVFFDVFFIKGVAGVARSRIILVLAAHIVFVS